MKTINDILGLIKLPGNKAMPFSAWQIELTTRCPLMCGMCIRSGSKEWHSADMDMESFKRLAVYFKDTEAVVLSGWGEPLLHKDLISAVRLVKEQGARAGFVTSGKGLNRQYVSELIDAGTDFIGFSLAGATPETHNNIRVNSDFNTLIDDIQSFSQIKRDKDLKAPDMHIVFLMLRDNIAEVPLLVQRAKDIGIDTVLLTNIIHITGEWQDGQRVFGCDKNRGQGAKGPRGQVTAVSDPRTLESLNPFYEILSEAKARAEELKINLRVPLLSPGEVAVCGENPLRNLYISVEGEVSPCVYLYPPFPSPFKRVFCGSEYTIEKVSFGNIFTGSFNSIWNAGGYKEFREGFVRRQKRFPGALLSDPPVQCETCHKMLGL